jgi:hypothetical protein
MTIEYRVYANDGMGGPVVYSGPVATLSALSYDTAPLAMPSDTTYAIRAFDPVTGLEGSNTDAIVRIVIGSDGTDRTAVPNPPIGLSARVTGSGTCRVEFTYVATGHLGVPTEWRAWMFSGAADFTLPPLVTVPANWPSIGEIYRHVAIDLTGLADGVSYLIGVRAANSAGDDGSDSTVAIVGRASAPLAVSGLAGVVGYGSIG